MGDQLNFSERGGWWVVAQIMLFIGAYYIPMHSGVGTPLAVSNAVTWSGYVLMIVGLLLFAAAAATLGRALTPFPRPMETGVLRTGGVYALIRHPIYAGVLLLALGWSLRHQSFAGLGYDVLLFVFFDRKSAREERWLVERYPDYSAYRKRVRKLIPWIY